MSINATSGHFYHIDILILNKIGVVSVLKS